MVLTRSPIKQTHRYFSTTHNLKAIEAILTRSYLHSATRQAVPKELTEAIGLAVSPALQAAQKEEIRRG
jgi:NAD(P)H-quinone oxidoreductase subunit K